MTHRLRLAVASAFVVLAVTFPGAAEAAMLTGTGFVSVSPDASIPVGTPITLTVLVDETTNHLEGNEYYLPSQGLYRGVAYLDMLDLRYTAGLFYWVNCYSGDQCYGPVGSGVTTLVLPRWQGPDLPDAGGSIQRWGQPQYYDVGGADRNSPNLSRDYLLLFPQIDIRFMYPEGAPLLASATVRFVPEASQLALLGTGLAGAVRLSRRRRV